MLPGEGRLAQAWRWSPAWIQVLVNWIACAPTILDAAAGQQASLSACALCPNVPGLVARQANCTATDETYCTRVTAVSQAHAVQVTGLTCDWLLVIAWGRLAYLEPRPVPTFAWVGCVSGSLHCQHLWCMSFAVCQAHAMQVTGLTCNWLLVIAWGRLAYLGTRPVPSFAWLGFAASCLHMADALPLVLGGMFSTPWIPGAPQPCQFAMCRHQVDLTTPVALCHHQACLTRTCSCLPTHGRCPATCAGRHLPHGLDHRCPSAPARPHRCSVLNSVIAYVTSWDSCQQAYQRACSYTTACLYYPRTGASSEHSADLILRGWQAACCWA